jgi:hypothetical protein
VRVTEGVEGELRKRLPIHTINDDEERAADACESENGEASEVRHAAQRGRGDAPQRPAGVRARGAAVSRARVVLVTLRACVVLV